LHNLNFLRRGGVYYHAELSSESPAPCLSLG